MFLFNNNKSFPKISEELSLLAYKFTVGQSTEADLLNWENLLNNLDKLISKKNEPHICNFKIEVKDLFYEYLLKHFPEDERLSKIYKNNEIPIARQNLYRKMVLRVLADALRIIESEEVKELIEKYMYYENDNYIYSILTDKGKAASNEELLRLAKDVRKYISTITEEQKNWHLKMDGLGAFMFLR